MRKIILTLIWLCVSGCGTDNVSPETGATDQDRAQQKMNDGEYEEAITILEPLVEEEPENYLAITLLAAAYAGKAGVTVLDILEAQLASTGESSNVFELVLAGLPADYGSTQIDDVNQAISLLSTIPTDLRGSSGDPEFGESAELQLIIYNAVYSSMLVGQFFEPQADGSFTVEDLENLTDEEAAAILAALGNIVDQTGNGESEELSEVTQETLDEIESSPGDTDREKIQNYLEAQEEE